MKKLIYNILDIFDKIRGVDNKLIPPRFIAKQFMPINRINYQQNYLQTSEEYKALFIQEGLERNYHVLEIGSGCGRMAIGLIDYVASYTGIDISKVGVDWCKANITTRYNNFQFQHLDLINQNYNPTGKPISDDFKFNLPENTFDYIYLTSVFTHMKPHDVKIYLGEIQRVLKLGGICFMTFYLINDKLKDAKQFTFNHKLDGYYCEYPEEPERAIAYAENDVIDMTTASGLEVKKIIYGQWVDRNAVQFQDVVIAIK